MQLFDVQILHQSEICRVKSFTCNYRTAYLSEREPNQSFGFCIMRSGYFEYHSPRKHMEMHVGRLLVWKPVQEHQIKLVKTQPDISTIIDFRPHFYELVREHYRKDAGWFFENADLNSLLIPCDAEVDHLHYLIHRESLRTCPDPMLMDDFVIDLVDKVMRVAGSRPAIQSIPPGLKKLHLSTVEQAKAFIIAHAGENMSLQKIADHCCVSLFHFSRIFKSVMRRSPYQYLNDIRLHNAKILLTQSALPVTQVAFQCGYNSLEQLDTAFRMKFLISPSAFRKNARS